MMGTSLGGYFIARGSLPTEGFVFFRHLPSRTPWHLHLLSSSIDIRLELN